VVSSKKAQTRGILVVSESSAVIKKYANALTKRGCRVVPAMNLVDAVGVVRKGAVAGVIVDTSVEGVRGYAVADGLAVLAPHLHLVATKSTKKTGLLGLTKYGSHVVAAMTPVADIVALACRRPRRAPNPRPPSPPLADLVAEPLMVEWSSFIEVAERFYLESILEASGQNLRLAAAIAGFSLATMYRKLASHDFDKRVFSYVGHRDMRKSRPAATARRVRR